MKNAVTGIRPSALRDCSTYQFRRATLSELEFHNNISRLRLIENN
jgi:hypothetical protein